ncbi:MAG: Hpt domain-containing protein [Gammaproteobacteria bacterium]|nr:Hpt domain-containing protein [Gammaproteobacteria bacterium]
MTSGNLTDNPVLDESALDRIRALQQPGSTDLVDRLIGIYLDTSQGLVEKIRTALAAGDARTICAAAHALKSSSGNMGATALTELAGQVECRTRDADLSDAQSLIGRLLEEHQRVTAALLARRSAA